jgi:ubiquinone/menaquinone biosynthesis C-methylase UbiE
MAQTSVRRERDFTPAVPVLGAYDLIVASLTRETAWRGRLLEQLDPRDADAIADVGCGTGTFLGLLGRAAPSARRAVGAPGRNRSG